tara:strand:- start:3 stop:908 length:906 start_codon:yes stop_codon:yes gene_type:complete
MKLKIGLIIQGPLNSTGIRGPYLRDKSRAIKNEKEFFTEYDCTQNIINLAKNAEEYFDEVVLSTWQHPSLEILEKNKSITKLIVSDESKFTSEAINNTIFLQNYKKMFHTIKVACDYLKSKNLDFIVKVRTDLEVDLKLLHDECIQAHNKNTILINNNIRDRKRFLEFDDFIFGAESNLFRKWMNNVIYIDFGKPAGTHSSLFISYIWTKYKDKFFMSKILFFHKSVVNNSKRISELAIEEWGNFRILGRNFWENCKLRGENIDSRYYDFIVPEPLQTPHKIKYNLKAYFQFFKKNFQWNK